MKKVKLWFLVPFFMVSGAAGSLLAEERKALPEIKEIRGNLEFNKDILVIFKEKTDFYNLPEIDVKKIRLYLDSIRIEDLIPVIGPEKNSILFRVDDSKKTEYQKSWNTLISRSFAQTTDIFQHHVQVGVGYDAQEPAPERIQHPLVIFNKTYFIIFVIFFVFVAVAFFFLAKKSGIMKDASELKPVDRPYSLARTQMAFWFFLVVISYVFLWLVTNNFGTLSDSTLGLVGISAATALGSVAIHTGKDETKKTKKEGLEKDYLTYKNRSAEIAQALAAQPQPSNATELQVEQSNMKSLMELTDRQIKELSQRLAPVTSKGFKYDIMADANGISLHRFQIVVWTLVLGIMFIHSIFTNLAMPEFSTNVLALMGISSGTYVGFKFPEK